jgi:hypothetical protein
MDASKYHIKLTVGELKKIYYNFPYSLFLKYRTLYANIGSVVKGFDDSNHDSKLLVIEFSDREMYDFVNVITYIRYSLEGMNVDKIINHYKMTEQHKKVLKLYKSNKQ